MVSDLVNNREISNIKDINKIYLHSVIHNLDYYDNFNNLIINLLNLIENNNLNTMILLADVPNKTKFSLFLKPLSFNQKIIYSCDRFVPPKIWNLVLNIRNYFRDGTMCSTLWYDKEYIQNIVGSKYIVKVVSDGTVIDHRSDFLIIKI